MCDPVAVVAKMENGRLQNKLFKILYVHYITNQIIYYILSNTITQYGNVPDYILRQSMTLGQF